jgi:hypothetical protein
MAGLNEHVLEVRYKPNPKVLDYRGTWAESISDHMKLPEWRIVENRIDIYDKKIRITRLWDLGMLVLSLTTLPQKTIFQTRRGAPVLSPMEILP